MTTYQASIDSFGISNAPADIHTQNIVNFIDSDIGGIKVFPNKATKSKSSALEIGKHTDETIIFKQARTGINPVIANLIY